MKKKLNITNQLYYQHRADRRLRYFESVISPKVFIIMMYSNSRILIDMKC